MDGETSDIDFVSCCDDTRRHPWFAVVADRTQSDVQFTVGLTGGIASGKSTIAGFFEALGVPVIDTDIVAREVVAPGSPGLVKIRESFGDSVIDECGSFDRYRMRKIIFSNDEKRLALERILHPLIRTETNAQAAAAEGDYVVIVVPLLFESPIKAEMDRIVVVDCEEETQIERLILRDNESRDQACRILAAQANREERLSIADDIVRNDGDLDSARERVQTLHGIYMELAHEQSN